MAAVVVLSGLACQKKQPAASAPTQFEEGALPPGCVVAARADISALGALGEAVRRAVTVDAEQEPALAGFDVRNFQRASFCKMPDAQAGSFVALLAGTIPVDLVETIGKRSAGALSQGTIAGAPFVAGRRVWFARRSNRKGGGELVVASTKELLGAALTSNAGVYALDPSLPLSVVIAGAEVKKRLPASASAGARKIQEMRLSASPNLSSVALRLVVGDAAIAQDLVKAYGPVLPALLATFGGNTGPPPQVALKEDAGDLVARIDLADGAVDALAAKLASRAPGTRPTRPTTSLR